MEILFLILKIIGIVLLAVLALILFSVILVLFVPIRYKLNAGYFDRNPDVNVRVSWLLHILHITLRITKEDKNCVIRIFGIPIMDVFHPRPKKEKPARTVKEKRKKRKIEKKEPAVADTGTKKEEQFSDSSEKKQKPEKSQTTYSESQKEDTDSADTEKKGLFEKISEFASKLSEAIASIPDKIHAAEEKGINAKSQAEKWITVLKRDKTKKAIECAKDLIVWLLKKLLPRKWSAYARFGFKDPSTTAQILGYYWMFIGILTDHVVCQPEFEKEVLEGKINIKGHIRACTFLRVGWKVLFDPNLKYLRKIKAEVDAL